MAYSEDELWDMDDDQFAEALKVEQAELNSPDVGIDKDAEPNVEQEQELDTLDNTDEDTEDTSEFDEELESDVEQPDEQDSDHDTSTDEVDVDTETDEPETEESTPDGETETVEDNLEVEEETKAEEVQPVQKRQFKAHGREYEFSNDEILEQFPKVFGQAMDYTKKMQAIKPWRKTIDAIEGAQLSHDDINLAIDILKGDKDAINEVIKRTGVDTLDLDAENSNYVAKDYGRDAKALDVKDIIDNISKDAEFSTTQNILGTQWDETSFNKMSDDPETIQLLHNDVKSGMFDKLQPIVDKLKVFSGGNKTDLEYYGMAAQEYDRRNIQEQKDKQEATDKAALVEKQASDAAAKAEEDRQAAEQARIAKVKADEVARTNTKNASKSRKAAATTNTISGKSKATDYMDDTEEGFREFYKRTTGEYPLD